MHEVEEVVVVRIKGFRKKAKRGATRKAKRECWNRFLQEAKGNGVWTATGYTAPRIDEAGQASTAEDGTVAEDRHERERLTLGSHFPKGPP